MRDLRLDRLSLQQSLVEEFVELLFILLSINHPLGQVPQPKPSTRVRKRWIHHLEKSYVIMEHGTSMSVSHLLYQGQNYSCKLPQRETLETQKQTPCFRFPWQECTRALPWRPVLPVPPAWCSPCSRCRCTPWC